MLAQSSWIICLNIQLNFLSCIIIQSFFFSKLHLKINDYYNRQTWNWSLNIYIFIWTNLHETLGQEWAWTDQKKNLFFIMTIDNFWVKTTQFQTKFMYRKCSKNVKQIKCITWLMQPNFGCLTIGCISSFRQGTKPCVFHFFWRRVRCVFDNNI